MTGNVFVDSLISLGAIGLMVALAWALFRAPAQPVTEAKARERLAFDEPDFSVVSWLFDKDGRAALAEGGGGEFALVSRLGADLVTRRFSSAGARVREEAGALVIMPGDPGSRPVMLMSSAAAEWARKFSY